MNIKIALDKNQTERERQQMSRRVLCLDGAELTRQLIRIEKESLHTSLDNYLILQNVWKNMAIIGS